MSALRPLYPARASGCQALAERVRWGAMQVAAAKAGMHALLTLEHGARPALAIFRMDNPAHVKGLEAAAKHFPPHVNKPQVNQGRRRGWESEWIWVRSQREGESKSE